MSAIAAIAVAAISTGDAVLITAAGTLLLGAVSLLKLRPEKQSLIAQAAEQATAAMAEAFSRLEDDLKRSREEVHRLAGREGELLRRLEQLEETQRRELEQLRERERELLERIGVLERELAARPPAD